MWGTNAITSSRSRAEVRGWGVHQVDRKLGVQQRGWVWENVPASQSEGGLGDPPRKFLKSNFEMVTNASSWSICIVEILEDSISRTTGSILWEAGVASLIFFSGCAMQLTNCSTPLQALLERREIWIWIVHILWGTCLMRKSSLKTTSWMNDDKNIDDTVVIAKKWMLRA